jgi:PAS domain S-box-containing protein
MNEMSLENYQKDVSARLEELSRYLRRYAKGDFAESIPIPDEDDQFASLFADVNEMITSIKETIEEKEQAIITGEKADNALRESEMDLAKAQRIAHVGNWNWDVRGKTLTWSDEIYRILGVDKGFELSFENITSIIHPDDRDRNRAFVGELFKKTEPAEIDFRAIRPDGRLVHIHQTAEVQCDEQGKPQCIFGIMQDVTEQKQAEEALRESEEKFRSLFNQSPLGIYIHNLDGEIINVNPTACKQLRYTQKELVKLSVFDLHPNSEDSINLPKDEILKLWKSWKPGDVYTISADHQRKDGTIFPAEILTSVVQLGEKRVILALVQDITERKRTEEIIRQHSEQLEEMVAERTQDLRDAQEQLIRQEKLAALGKLAGSVSHELRNPLSVINNAAYYLNLKLTDADEDIKQSLEMINEETQNATKIISDLLDFGRIKTSERTPVNLSKLIRTYLKRNPPPEHITIDVDVSEKLPLAFVDGEQIIQVIDNLISNAYEAMPEGGKLSVIGKPFSKNSIQISVRDTGTGIPPENREKIFEPLFTTKPRGIGLGLAITKSLVEANEGQIEVDSEINVGTKFRVFLPTGEVTEKR